MDRPVMNPSLLQELEDAPERRRRQRRLAAFRRIAGLTWKVLLFEPLGFMRRYRTKVEIGTPLGRLCRGVLYRLLGLPVVIIAVAMVMVFNGTHPPIVPPTTDPQSLGIYHDPVSFLAADDTRLEAWLIPVVDAKRVLQEKDEALRGKNAAVVLVHDYGATREEMLPLVKPLHEAGFVILVVSLRGNDSRMPAGQTFGLNESGDVAAAVELLRRRPNVAANRIALVGVGTGATASLLAAQHDPEIAALVLDNPVKHVDDVLTRIAPTQWWLRWMRPTCKWTFELAYGVDADAVSFGRLESVMDNRPCLMLDNGNVGTAGMKRQMMGQVVDFLKTCIGSKETAVAITPQN